MSSCAERIHPAGRSLDGGEHHRRIVHVLGLARVDDVPTPERLAPAQREVADGGIDRTERLDDRRRQVRAPAVGERHPPLRQVHGVQRIGPPVVGAEAHPGERADAGVGIDEVEVVALAPRRIVADGMEQLVGGVGSGGHGSGVPRRDHRRRRLLRRTPSRAGVRQGPGLLDATWVRRPSTAVS